MKLIRRAFELMGGSVIANAILVIAVAFISAYLLPFATEVQFTAGLSPRSPFYVATVSRAQGCNYRLVDYRVATIEELRTPPSTDAGECRSDEGLESSFVVLAREDGGRDILTRMQLDDYKIVSRYYQGATSLKPVSVRVSGPSHSAVGLLIGLGVVGGARFLARRQRRHSGTI